LPDGRICGQINQNRPQKCPLQKKSLAIQLQNLAIRSRKQVEKYFCNFLEDLLTTLLFVFVIILWKMGEHL
jgi:hypothetical protein